MEFREKEGGWKGYTTRSVFRNEVLTNDKPNHSICLASSGTSSQSSIFRVFTIKYGSLSRDLSKMTKGAPVVTAARAIEWVSPAENWLLWPKVC